MIKVSKRIHIELELDEEDAKKLFRDLNVAQKKHQVSVDLVSLLQESLYPPSAE